MTTYRTTYRVLLPTAVALALLYGVTRGVSSARASDFQDEVETPTPTPTETPTPTATETPEPPPFDRPLVVVQSYKPKSGVRPGGNFDLQFRLANAGQGKARNVVVIFATGDFFPRGNGGVIAAGTLSSGTSTGYTQPLTVGSSLVAGTVGVAAMQVNYVDDAGTAYSESFTLSIKVGNAQSGASGSGAVRTPTPTPNARPQLLIRDYQVDAEVLKPGSRFTISLEVHNVGEGAARRVSMIIGGGMSSNGSGSEEGSDGRGGGGLSGAGGDFANFAPLETSNVQYLGDLAVGVSLVANQSLIVNSKTEPGAYPLKVSFVYTDEKENTFVDEQVITLLVLSPPLLEISYYRPPDPLFVGQPGTLPFQVVNLGQRNVILGRFEVQAEGAQLENNSVLVGYLDPGGYFTLDPMVIPNLPGTLTVRTVVGYVDDFNQPQSFAADFEVEVLDAPVFGPGEGEFPGGESVAPPSAPETFLQVVWRFVRGLIGLDSGRSEPGDFVAPPPEGSPPEMEPPVEVVPRKG